MSKNYNYSDQFIDVQNIWNKILNHNTLNFLDNNSLFY